MLEYEMSFDGREMYMNCAMVNIDNRNTSAVLEGPEIFKANIGQFGEFKTVEGADVTLPDPGTSVDNSLGDRKLNQPVLINSNIQLPSPAPEVGVIVLGGNEPIANQVPNTSPTVAKNRGPGTSYSSQVNTSVAQSSPASKAPVPATTAEQQGARPTGANAPAAISGTCAEGTLICSADGTMFSICVGGKPSTLQAVAPGTACRNGAIGYAKFIRKRSSWWS